MHVDAYRLGGIDELDDLDLDTSLDDAVTVVEWGEGIAEGLAESRLEVRIIRALADEDDARRPRPAPGADDAGRAALVRDGGARRASAPPLAEKLNENLLLDFRRCAESELDRPRPAHPAARCR